MNLKDYLVQRIPIWETEKRFYIRLRSADGVVLSAVPIVGNLSPSQIVRLMMSENSSFIELCKCKVLEEVDGEIIIDLRLH